MNFSTSINVINILSPLDWGVIIASLFLTVLLVVYGQNVKKCRYKKYTPFAQTLECLLMGRQLTLPLFIATLCSTWYGGIFGVTQNAFNQGIYNFFTQGFFWYLAYLFFAFFIVKKIRGYRVFSLPELVEKLYGTQSAKLSALLILFKTLPITYTISIGLFLQFFLPVSLETNILIGVGFVMLYSLWGGFRAVVYSDLAQFLIMWIGVVMVLLFSIFQFGGLTFLRNQLPASYFDPRGTFSWMNTLTWLFIAFSTTLINPLFYQRCFAAKSAKTAQTGIVISTLIWLLFDLATTFGGMYAKAVIPEANSLDAYMIYSLQLLPTGFRGLLIAAVMATILSTLDSFLILSSNTLAFDLGYFNSSDKKIKHIFSVLIVGVVSSIIAWCMDGNLENIWRFTRSSFSVCLLIPIAWGYCFPQSIKDKQFIVSSLAGCLSMIYWKVCHLDKSYALDSFYVGSLFVVLCFILFSLKNHFYTRNVSKFLFLQKQCPTTLEVHKD